MVQVPPMSILPILLSLLCASSSIRSMTVLEFFFESFFSSAINTSPNNKNSIFFNSYKLFITFIEVFSEDVGN